MKIEHILVKNSGYVHCKSSVYSSHDTIDEIVSYQFKSGINMMRGEIDSGIWAVSYLLSMYIHKPKDFILFLPPQVMVNHTDISLTELAKYTCYMDKSYPLFSGKRSVEKMILQGLREHSLPYGTEDIRNLFCLDKERFSRPLTGVGNEIFNAMAAIGYCHGKQVFCFPWLSNNRFQYYKGRMPKLMETLQGLNLIVVLPMAGGIDDVSPFQNKSNN